MEAAGSDIKITPAQAEQVVNTMEKYIANGTLTEIDKVAVLPIEKETTFKLESKVIDTNNDKEETVTDEIVLPANTVVIFTSGVASTLNISRTDEGKEGASIREYDGTPTGTIFVTPMEVKFTPAVVVAQEKLLKLHWLLSTSTKRPALGKPKKTTQLIRMVYL